MSAAYNTQWGQQRMNFPPLQLEQEYSDFVLPDQHSQHPHSQHHQQQQVQQRYGSQENYTYQQNLPINSSSNLPGSSSLHGAFSIPQNADSHNRTPTYGSTHTPQGSISNFVQGGYPAQPQGQGQRSIPQPYRSTPTAASFTFTSNPSSGTMPMQGVDTPQSANLSSNFVTASPSPMHQTLNHSVATGGQSTFYHDSSNDARIPPPKRQHTAAFEHQSEDHDGDVSQEAKDAKSKSLARACQRCKNLKVRCEAKTETEPCKRCFNGGHECVIPGRKIRRTPPKREHLLSEIQSQAKEIERLMHLLENTTKPGSNVDHGDAKLGSPVLSPSSASGSFFGGSEGQPNGKDDVNHASGTVNQSNSNSAVNKAVEDWIAKARDSLNEFGAFIGIGGAGMPQSYLVEQDYEGNSSGDEEFVDVREDLEGFGNEDDRYDVAIERAEGSMDQDTSPARSAPRQLQHKHSGSSIGTANTSQVRRKTGETSKPVNLPGEAAPFGLFGQLSLKDARSRDPSVEPEEDNRTGIANENFFKSSSAPNVLGRRLASAAHQAPAILTRGIITPQEAEKLFKIYFDNMNLSVSLLDPVLYTAQRTFYRSPFLFTVICAIASRFYTERPSLYAQVMHFAQLAAGTALISGTKNVEMVQAYILLSLYPVPARKWEDQRSWLYLGLAIRTATDLNLHLPVTAKPVNENHAREMLNRTRVWLNCFNLDRSTGSQYGKPPIINARDYTANHSEQWYSASPYNMHNFDIHLSAYNSELKVMANFIAKIYSDPTHPTGLNREVDFEAIATATDDELKALGQSWFSKIHSQTDLSDPQNSFRTGLLKLAYSYSRLIALSYGFQHAFGKSDEKDENPFLTRCLQAATDVVNAVVKDICRPSQIHFWRHGPEAQSVFVTFASAFLVKLLQPKFASYIPPEKRHEIQSLVQQVIDLLGSPEVAIDERHGPKLYSRFLEKLLAKPMAKLDNVSPGIAAPPSRKPRRPRSSGSGQPEPSSTSSSFDLPQQPYNHGSPSTSNSLSPPVTTAALSFEHFAPVNGLDPFAPESAGATSAMNTGGDGYDTNMGMGDFLQPSLPFDNDIVQSWQSLTDPNAWSDISLPGFNWMTQFQQNLGLDLNGSANSMYAHDQGYAMKHAPQ